MPGSTNATWKRPDSVPFPTTWYKFKGRREIDGVIPKFWIQDVPEDQFDVVIDMMVNHFLKDEPISFHSDFLSDKESVAEFRLMWGDVLKDKLGLVCYMENPDQSGDPIMAAVNCTHLVHQSNKKSESKVKGVKAVKILSTIDYVVKIKDLFAELNIDKYLNAMGLYVLPQFRGQGLGLELLKARKPLCKAMGIDATATIFTATASQILANRAGFKEFTTIAYEDLEKANPAFRFAGIEKHTKSMKYMYILY